MNLREIRELLILKGWSREVLAERLGITRNTVDRWFCVREGNRRYPSANFCEVMKSWLAEAREEFKNQPELLVSRALDRPNSMAAST